MPVLVLMALLLMAPCGLSVAAQERKVAAIDFFGHQGVDVEAIRRALPIHEGDIAPKDGFETWREAVQKAVLSVSGRESTDEAFVCCWDGNWVVYIGLRGATLVDPKFKSAPVGAIRLPEKFMKLDRDFMRAWEQWVKSGRKDALNSRWLAMRKLAPMHEPALVEAGVQAADSEHRAAAVFAIGHALEPSPSRLAVLLSAALDPDSTVRNNAVRGLAEWAQQHPEWRAKISPDVGIDLLRSGKWTDRNKGAYLLLSLTEGREEGMMGKIREQALPALREMALWRWAGHNAGALLILGRVAGIEERRLQKMIDDGDAAEIVRISGSDSAASR
jgi:hypothetical protein